MKFRDSYDPTLEAVIIDDEATSRAQLSAFLQEQDEIELVGQAADGAAAVQLIRELEPDLVFLEVKLPELDGLEILETLEEEVRPWVVFVTASADYAVTAFDLDAVDYLTKPLDEGRLAECMRRIRRRLAREENREEPTDDRQESIRRFLVRTRGSTLVIRARDVNWFEADDNYVRLHMGDTVHIVRSQLTSLQAGLDPQRFVRVHRSAIVNLERVAELDVLNSGDCKLILDTGSVVRMSRRYRKEFEDRLQAAP